MNKERVIQKNNSTERMKTIKKTIKHIRKIMSTIHKDF